MQSRAYEVVVVEDEPDVAAGVARLLEAANFRVTAIVSNQADVIPIVSEKRPDVVLIDIHIADNGGSGPIDGIALAEEIVVCEDIACVFLSGATDPDIVRRAVRSGAYGFLSKPVGLAELVTTLTLAIHKHTELRVQRDDADWLAIALNAVHGAVVGLDQRGRVRFMNRAAVQLTGWQLMEAKDTAPKWAVELDALEANATSPTAHSVPLSTKQADALHVHVQKIPCADGSTLYLIDRADQPSLWVR